MELCKARGSKPILLGDFNNFDLGAYKKDILSNYIISTDVAQYISMPKDNGTLDYIAAPKGITLHNVICPELYVSDHRPVLGTITM